jgi:GTP-binding protein EngB required for normal cell division
MNGLKFIVWLLVFILEATSNFAFSAEAFDERPHEHFCPINLAVMTDPVVAADGHSYERKAILAHLATSNLSPITGAVLKNKDLFDNQALKTTIIEYKPGKHSEPSVLDSRSAEEIARRVKEEFDRNNGVFNSAAGKDIVVFLGNTGAGKSTLINFLAGKELRVGPYDDYVLANPEDTSAMAIGTGGNSETLYPKYVDVNGLRFFDLPGFNDTDGSERNLVNASFIRQILLTANSVRLVFVAGQDQFTADRSASVKHMFNCIKHLFVVDQSISLVDDALFIATKVTWNKQGELANFLLYRTHTRDRGELSEQLKSWHDQGRLSCMFHPVRDEQNKDIREQILKLITETKATKIIGINVSNLYPSDTNAPLERMFSGILGHALERKFQTPLKTLSDYDSAIDSYMSKNFWQKFDNDVCLEDEATGLLKEFCINQYGKALKNLEKQNERRRQVHIQNLRDQRQARIADIEKQTEENIKRAILDFGPKIADGSLAFDFAYHKDFYAQVCTPFYLNRVSCDELEQEVIRQYYAGFMARHGHEQMLKWYQKHSGIEPLLEQIEDLKQKYASLENLVAQLKDQAKPEPEPKAEPKKAAYKPPVSIVLPKAPATATPAKAENPKAEEFDDDDMELGKRAETI